MTWPHELATATQRRFAVIYTLASIELVLANAYLAGIETAGVVALALHVVLISLLWYASARDYRRYKGSFRELLRESVGLPTTAAPASRLLAVLASSALLLLLVTAVAGPVLLSRVNL